MKKYLFLYICTLIAALGGLLSGYDTGVISGALIFINQNFHLTSFLSGLLVASVSLGAVFGAFVNGFLADKIGRKNTLILISIVFLIASIFCAVSKNPTELIIARFMLGIGVGVVSFICPLYISEISPKEKRGSSVCLFQLAITFGILFS
ncbi:MFS transporter, partial [bacterium]|nr:MFS transporter [bacterium]